MQYNDLSLHRFMDFCRVLENGCWVWRGATNKRQGQPAFSYRGGMTPAHRYIYSVHFGPILPGYIIVRECATPGCVNPEHLRKTTMAAWLKERTVKRMEPLEEIEKRMVEAMGSDNYVAGHITADKLMASLAMLLVGASKDKKTIECVRRIVTMYQKWYQWQPEDVS